jgi:hypothetical protein
MSTPTTTAPAIVPRGLRFVTASSSEDGVAIFDALHRRGRATDAILQAFDLLELEGEDLRPLPLAQSKKRLARLLARVAAGIAINEHTDEDGAMVFLHAWRMGLEEIVSKRLTAPYRSGRSRDGQGQRRRALPESPPTCSPPRRHLRDIRSPVSIASIPDHDSGVKCWPQ